jgi:hypothetical protein
VTLAAAGDVEGHQALDGRFYLLDTGRAFPPESPMEDDSAHLSPHPQSIFFRLLRPELLQRLRDSALLPPLNPDALR